MVKPDFTKVWAGSRVSIPAISSPDYVKGFAAYLGPLPPQTDDHDYIMNLQDLRALWLEAELATKTAAATDTTAGIVQLAVAANYPSASDSEVATPAYVSTAISNSIPAATETVAGIIEIATSAESIAGLSDAVVLTPLKFRNALNASGTAPVFGVRAFVVFDGAGVAGLRSSGNVSSVTRNSIGDYTVNFTTPLPTFNYAYALTAGDAAATSNAYATGPKGTPTTSSFSFQVRNDSATLIDQQHISATFTH